MKLSLVSRFRWAIALAFTLGLMPRGAPYAAQQRPLTAADLPKVGAAGLVVDASQFRLEAQASVDAFAAEVAKARKGEFAVAPSVEVRNTPQLIFFESGANRIVVPWWESTPPEMRSIFRTFAAGGDAEAERLFRVVFNRFLIAHEAGHWFQARANRREATLYQNEDAANRLAVAFWRTQPGGERFLAQVEQLVTRAAAALTDPTPAGEDAVAYFGANYQALGRDPLKYGYYQFRFMRDALAVRAQLDFARMVEPSLK
jgi:hypothetical protein